MGPRYILSVVRALVTCTEKAEPSFSQSLQAKDQFGIGSRTARP